MEERLITTQSGTFNWSGRAASVWFYVYDEKGGLTGKDILTRNV